MGIEFTEIGHHWPHGGNLFYMRHGDRPEEATVYVDSLGETWVSVYRIPEGGYFFTERVEAWRAVNAREAELDLLRRGFGSKRTAQYAHRVIERDV